jgi:hypothetical protein
VPKIDDYDRSCTADTDCVAAFAGDPGCCGQCANGAVRATELDRVLNDDARARSCEAAPPFCPSTCREIPAFCVQGTCQLPQRPATLSLSTYDRSCKSVADCTAVFFSDHPTCCSSSCPNAAVRTSAAVLVDLDIAAARDCSGNGRCAADAGGICDDGRVLCVQGVCQFAMPARDAGGPE